jgi:hypothetical protein
MAKIASSVTIVAAVGLAVVGCSSSSGGKAAAAGNHGCKTAAEASSLAALPGYQVCLFAAATTNMNHPDDIQVIGSKVWIGWQNQSAKDGSTNVTSTIAEYTTAGKLLKTWSVIGHADGLHMDPATNVMWVTANEDAKPRLYLINPSSSSATTVTVPPTPHGGGLDDLRFVNGTAYVSASNPTLSAAGKNTGPALLKMTVTGTKAHLSPALMANAKATALIPPISTVTLNLTDPDSQQIDPQGDLMLNSQADQELVFIHAIGTVSQKVSVLAIGTQVDDVVWPTSAEGCLLVADNSSGVYSVCSSIWVPGTVMVDSANDSTVINFVGTLNPGSGQITPTIVGFGNPHGMAFIQK